MTDQLKELLYTYIGELMHELGRSYDWHKKAEIAEKINAIYKLLDINERSPVETGLRKL